MKLISFILMLLALQGNSQQHFRPEKKIRDRLARLVPKNYLFNKEEQAIIDRCNTAQHSIYYTDTEKEFILLMNLARSNPTALQSFITHRYDSSLWKQLPSITSDSSRLILETSFGLHLSALVHAKKSGRMGTMGHQNIDRRIKMFNFYFRSGAYGENCNYSSSSHPLLHFINLMRSNPHFKNIMSSNFNSVGVSFKNHVRFGKNSVTCFGWK